MVGVEAEMYMALRIFLTGTDTGVGKTCFGSWLVRCWKKQGHAAIGLKPIASGDREDAIQYHQAVDAAIPLEIINPVCLQLPAAPLVAAEKEGLVLNLKDLNASIKQSALPFSHTLVEGVGGWKTPLTPEETVADWAAALNWPVMLVARDALGTLNHTLLTVESIRQHGLICRGIVLNRYFSGENHQDLKHRATLERFTGLPVFEFFGASHPPLDLPAWLSNGQD